MRPLEPHLKYAEVGLDRAVERREDSRWIARTLKQADTQFIAVWRKLSLLRIDGPEQACAARLSPPHINDPDQAIFLGVQNGVAVFAVDFSEQDDPPTHLVPGSNFVELRRFGPLLAGPEAHLLAYARAMVNWHQTHRYCGHCGSPTLSVSGGHRRQCANPSCGQISFPRTDPAIIVLVEHACDDGGPPRCLLGRSARFPAGMYSTLAGFVEPGESLEQAVQREVLEESDVQLSAVRYLASQPWPFPGSLMIGFHATASTTAIRCNDAELQDARWFSRDELQQFGEAGEFADYCLPRPDSIARFLIESWRDGGHRWSRGK